MIKTQARDSFNMITEFSLSRALNVREGEMRRDVRAGWLHLSLAFKMPLKGL